MRFTFARPARSLAAASLAIVLVAPVAAASEHETIRAVGDPAVVSAWNAIAARTIYTENATPIPSSGLYFGFVGVAVEDAVKAAAAQPGGRVSAEAAAAAAAAGVLTAYFPTSATALHTDLAASLARIAPGAARRRGVRAGESAAAALVAARVHDGRGAAVPQPGGLAPGQWRPTPEALAPMAVPWLGFVTPLSLTSPTEVALPGPDALTSAAYAADYDEVKAYGSATGSLRDAGQTDTALFFTANAVLQYQVALRDQVTRRGLDLQDSARAFALLGASTADALIACWRAKYDYAYWRPITAIRLGDTDGNAETVADPTWTPLVPTPPYGDYVSGHACVTGAATGTLSRLFGADSLDLTLSSSAAGLISPIRSYATAADLDRDTMNARIWLGLHFRRAMTDGNLLGHQVADLTWSRRG